MLIVKKEIRYPSVPDIHSSLVLWILDGPIRLRSLPSIAGDYCDWKELVVELKRIDNMPWHVSTTIVIIAVGFRPLMVVGS